MCTLNPLRPPQNSLHDNVNLAPHIVLLGAGASVAAYLDWGRVGNPLPSMQDLIDTLALRKDIEGAGFDPDGLNFEAFYDEPLLLAPFIVAPFIEPDPPAASE
jgi:hypothetical protein